MTNIHIERVLCSSIMIFLDLNSPFHTSSMPPDRFLCYQAARQAMKDPVVVAMFRSVEPASSPLPSIMPKQETDGLSERR